MTGLVELFPIETLIEKSNIKTLQTSLSKLTRHLLIKYQLKIVEGRHM